MKVKVCGITQQEQLLALQNMRVDYAGLIFHPGSKRFVGDKLNKQDASTVTIKKVGVFVNQDAETIKTAVADFGLSAVQLHGEEMPELCAAIQQMTVVIKALTVSETTDLNHLAQPYVNSVDYLLFDTGKGGTGKKWNWNLLQQYNLNKPFFMSGGIGPQDAALIKKLNHPRLYAVDINSCFETGPGVKDLAMVQAFIKEL